MTILEKLAIAFFAIILMAGTITCFAENGITITSVEISENELDDTVMDVKVTFTAPEGVNYVSLLLTSNLETYTTDPKQIIHIDQFEVPENGVHKFSFYKDRVKQATGLDSVNGVTLYLKMNYENSEEDPASSQGKLEEKPSVRYGDANGDGEINLKDVIILRRYIVGGYGVEYNVAFDVNHDEAVNLKDVITVRRFVVGGYDIEL